MGGAYYRDFPECARGHHAPNLGQLVHVKSVGTGTQATTRSDPVLGDPTGVLTKRRKIADGADTTAGVFRVDYRSCVHAGIPR